MRILLVGEYSRLHNSLKEGLINLGHQVIIIGTGDGFKRYPVDVDVQSVLFKSFLLNKFKNFIYILTKIDLTGLEKAYKYYFAVRKMNNFDVVQFINEESLRTGLRIEKKLINLTVKKSKKSFLLSCGTDYISVKYAFEKNFKYSILTPYFDLMNNIDQYQYVLKYINKAHKKHHHYLYDLINGVIATDIDYHIPLINHSKYLGLIPNPINVDEIDYNSISLEDEIIIFHGVNKSNYYKKGNYLFDKALHYIEEKYSERVSIKRTENVPYSQYIKSYDSCHIFLDQIYAYDQGYNALEAMAKGKVVFTGAETEFLNHYKLKENEVCINAVPDLDELIQKLELLILNPKLIVEISNNAHEFIKKHHHYINIADKYIKKWAVS